MLESSLLFTASPVVVVVAAMRFMEHHSCSISMAGWAFDPGVQIARRVPGTRTCRKLVCSRAGIRHRAIGSRGRGHGRSQDSFWTD
jgi:hypothetical protein